MELPYSIWILLRERGRYFPAVLAVTFSAVLSTIQAGLLLGFLAVTSRPIERVAADLWVCSRDVSALGYSHAIEEHWWTRLASTEGIAWVEPYLYGFGLCHRGDGGVEQFYLVGCRLEGEAIGVLQDLTPEQRRRLARPGTVAIYAPDCKLLGLKGIEGEVAEVAGQRVEVAVILHKGPRGAGLVPGVFASLRTARRLLPGLLPEQATYFVARCHDPAEAPRIAERLRRQHGDWLVLTQAEFAWRTQDYWLTRTRAGLVLAFSTCLGLIIGLFITGQTLYSATTAARRELSVLRAMGIPRRKISGLVVLLSFWVALVGVLLAIPPVLVIIQAGLTKGVEAIVPLWLYLTVGGMTLFMAMLSSLFALRSLRRAEPADLLR